LDADSIVTDPWKVLRQALESKLGTSSFFFKGVIPRSSLDLTREMCLVVKELLHVSILQFLVRHVSRGKERVVEEAKMTRQYRPSETLRSITGGTLVGIGLHILSRNLDSAAAHWRHLVSITTEKTLGVLPSIVLAASQAVQAYAFDHESFFLALLRMLIALWPLLLVIAGTVLLRDIFTDRVIAAPRPGQYFQKNDFKKKTGGCRFCCPSFDV
jgi:hypothetical protein